MIKGGYLGKLLYVNLTEKVFKDIDMTDDFMKKYLGGKGFGARLLYELVDDDVEALSPDNVLMFLTGPLTGTAAPAMRSVVVTKSPLTETINDSYFGGHLGHELKYAGYDGLIIKGRADKPVELNISPNGVELRDASDVWGLDIYETYEFVKKKKYNNRIKIACIGPAGENLVRYACIDCDPHRQAGRGGTGAVMGSKKLKMITIQGDSIVPINNKLRFKELLKDLYNDFPPEGNHHTDSGTVGTIEFANSSGFFPYRNFQDGVMENAMEKLGPDNHKEEFWLKDFGCSGCIIRCGKLGKLRGGKNQGLEGDITEYETIGLLGSNLDINDSKKVTYLGNLCDRLGMDTISTGGVIGFAIESFRNGILTAEDTDGLELDFGKNKEIIELINKIAYRKGIGDVLAEGSKIAAKEINEKSDYYAMHGKGLEIPAWAPRGTNSMALAYMTNDRGSCHMRAFGIGIELENGEYPGGQVKHLDPKGIGPLVAWLQDTTAASYSFTQCAFGRNIIDAELALKFLEAATGWSVSEEELKTIGERIWNITRLFNIREGFTREDDNLPKRFKEEPLPSGPYKGHKIEEDNRNIMLDEYYKHRGWNKNGNPKKETLERLELDKLDDESIF